MKRLLSLLLMLLLLSSLLSVQAESAVIPAAAGDTISFGDSGEDVMALQTRLKELLYYSGLLDGRYGERTREAVLAVQRAYSLDATGNADDATLAIIYGECYKPLEEDDSGTLVQRMQERLIALGYLGKKATGKYLINTVKAVSAFQRDNGLPETGKADVDTQSLLYSENYARQTASPTPAGMTATPVPAVTPAPAATEMPDIVYKGKLSYGSSGSRVKLLQERLKELGFFTGKTSEGYYERTHTAVVKFQKYNGLAQDGEAGEETWNALWADPVNASSTPKPTPEPTPIPYYVEVDVNNQVINVYGRDETGGFTKLEHQFICSTGTTSYPSDVGLWTLTGRRAKWATFPTWGGGWARYWLRINSNIAFHSVLYETTDIMDLKISAFNKLGKRASHGCIRMTVADAKWMYYNCGKGVQVLIREDLSLDPELTYSLKPAALNKRTMLPYETPAPTPQPAYDGKKVPEGKIRALSVGSQGEDVHWLQSKLKELGYYKGTVTGQYREGTKAAVKAYQKDNKLSGGGSANEKTLKHLYNVVIEANATPAPTPEPTPEPTPTASLSPVS